MSTSIIRGKYLISRAGESEDTSLVIADGAVFQRDGLIVDVGSYQSLRSRYEADHYLGGPEYLVIPGLVNAHHHGRGVSTLQMGTCDDSLETWILAGWGRRPYDHYLMTLYTALQMLESGTTTVMYNHPQTPVETLDADISEVLRGFSDAGMRVAFSVYFRNQNRVVYTDDQIFLSGLPPDLADFTRQYLSLTNMTDDDYFALFERTHQQYGSDPSGKVRVLLSPSNVQWNSDDFLQRTKQYASNYKTGVHMHLVESFYQREYGLQRWGKTPVAHLQDLEFLGPELSCAHAVWLMQEDIHLLADSQTSISHNPSSNLRLKNGVAPVNRLLKQGVNVALGTDSTAINDDDDMLQEMRLATKLHREPGIGAPALSTHQSLKMATINAALPTCFQDEIGALEKGRRADMSLIRLSGMEVPYVEPDVSIFDKLLYRGKVRDVAMVIIDWEVVMRDGQSTRVSREDVQKQLAEQFSRPLDPQTLEARQKVRQLLPYVEQFYQTWRPNAAP